MTMSGYRSFTLCFVAAIFSQLSAAPTPAPQFDLAAQSQASMNNLSSQGQQYSNYAMNEASSNAQYATDQMKANSQYAVDQMKSNSQQAIDAGKNLVNKAQNSIGNISLNPLSYMPSWMQPDPYTLSHLAQTTSDYANYYAHKGNEMLHKVGEQSKDMLKSAQETGSDLIQRGVQNGQYYLSKAKENISGLAQSGIGQGRSITQGGLQQGAQSVQSMGGIEKSYLGVVGDKLDAINGYIAEKLYKTADGVGNLSIPNLDQQFYSY